MAFVPTMGALHEGHLQLCRRALELCPRVVVSIYVNPLQFGPKEDFSSYPRTLERDLDLLRPLGVSAVLAPVSLMENGSQVSVKAGPMSEILCGASRPGHFDGVLTVLTKLFNVVRPSVAVFGRKDFQQCAVVKKWVQDMLVPIHIETHTIVRDQFGLALSSRNMRLSSFGRQQALAIYRSLKESHLALMLGQDDPHKLKSMALAALSGLDVDYVEIRDPLTLMEVPRVLKGTVMLVAARVEGVRLIDNWVLGVDTPVMG